VRLLSFCYKNTLRLLSSAATASTQWRVREFNCPTTYHDARSSECQIRECQTH